MNKMNKLFAAIVLSAVGSSTAIFADYSSSAWQGQQYPSGQTGQYYSGEGDYQNPGISGSGASMRRGDQWDDHSIQQDQSMPMHEGQMRREGYNPNQGHYQSAPQHYSRYPQTRYQEPVMEGPHGYGYHGYESSAATPQSYSLDDGQPGSPHYPQQGHYGAQGQGNWYQGQHPTYGYEIKQNESAGQHRVYEYVLGKDGKWHNVTAQDANAIDKQSPENIPLKKGPTSIENQKQSSDSEDKNKAAYYYQQRSNSRSELIGDRSAETSNRNY